MRTIEQQWDLDPEPDPPTRPFVRDPSVDDWQKAQDQYERHLDRLGGDDK